MKDNVLKEVLNWLEQEIHTLTDEIDDRNETVASLQKLASELEEYENYSEYKDKYEKVAADFDTEKERLIKLHKHYRELDEECKNLKREAKGWQDWFYANKDIYDRLFSAPPPDNFSNIVKKNPTPQSKAVKKKSKAKKKK